MFAVLLHPLAMQALTLLRAFSEVLRIGEMCNSTKWARNLFETHNLLLMHNAFCVEQKQNRRNHALNYFFFSSSFEFFTDYWNQLLQPMSMEYCRMRFHFSHSLSCTIHFFFASNHPHKKCPASTGRETMTLQKL